MKYYVKRYKRKSKERSKDPVVEIFDDKDKAWCYLLSHPDKRDLYIHHIDD